MRDKLFFDLSLLDIHSWKRSVIAKIHIKIIVLIKHNIYLLTFFFCSTPSLGWRTMISIEKVQHRAPRIWFSSQWNLLRGGCLPNLKDSSRATYILTLEQWNAWLGRGLKYHPVPATRSCSKPHPTWLFKISFSAQRTVELPFCLILMKSLTVQQTSQTPKGGKELKINY